MERLEKGERFLSLDDRDKWLFWAICMLAAHKNNKIPLETGYLFVTLAIKTKANLLERIKKLAFLKLVAIKSASKSASKLLASASIFASPSRVEKSREENIRVEKNKLLNKFKL
jgi:hypothetical protein